MSRFGRRSAGLALVALMAIAGCGTRVEDHAAAPVERIGSAQTGPVGSPVSTGSAFGEEAATGSSVSGADSLPVRVAPADGRASGVTPGAVGQAQAGSVAGVSANPHPGSSEHARPSSPGTPSPAPAAASPRGVPAGPAPGTGAQGHSPAVFASVSTLSGPAGLVLAPVVQGAQLWVKHINGKGGLNGHPVQLIVYDDGADPARHRAQVQEAVERRQVIGFLAEAAVLTARPSLEYVNAKRIPVVGTSGGSQWAYESPMYFPQATEGDAAAASWIVSVAGRTVPRGKTKLGTLVCTEAQGCDEADKIFAREAPGAGFQHVYRGKSSLAQPDFTAECLSARNAGADVILIVLDTNSTSRVAGSCARQNYRPIIATIVTPVQERMKNDPNLDGMVTMSHNFPWFQSGTPATDEFQAALKSFGGGMAVGVGVALGWTAGKLLEKAAAALPEPPTKEAVLAGLWSIRNDDLGGLTQPLTFVSDKPTIPLACWFDIQIQNRGWVSPDRYARHCR